MKIFCLIFCIFFATSAFAYSERKIITDPNGTYSAEDDEPIIMAPDGTYIQGTAVMAPDGTYIGIPDDDRE